MNQMNIHEAKTHFSRLVERARQGEEIVIARDGKPIAKLGPLEGAGSPPVRRVGFMKGEFDVPLNLKDIAREEIEEMFYGDHD